MRETVKINNAITQGVIWKQLLAFFFPVLMGTLFQQLYNAVDAVIVGRFVGKAALAAVGSTGAVVNLTVGIFNGVTSGAVVIIVIVVVVVRKRKKAKALAALEEDSDEDI